RNKPDYHSSVPTSGLKEVIDSTWARRPLKARLTQYPVGIRQVIIMLDLRRNGKLAFEASLGPGRRRSAGGGFGPLFRRNSVTSSFLSFLLSFCASVSLRSSSGDARFSQSAFERRFRTQPNRLLN